MDKEWTGRLLICPEVYDHKPDHVESAGITRRMVSRIDVTPSDFAELVSDGIPYCPTSRKLDEVRESDFIIFDIDYSPVPMDTFIGLMAVKPTLAYESCSNNSRFSKRLSIKKFKDLHHRFRFRLVYALKTPTTSKEEYEAVEDEFIRMAGIPKPITDHLQPNQLYFGCYNTRVIVTGIIHEKPVVGLSVGGTVDEVEPSDTKTVTPKKDSPVISVFSKTPRYRDFLRWYIENIGRPEIVYETPYMPSETDERILVPSDIYMTIPRKYLFYDKEKHQRVFGRWADGENRHGRIFQTGLILKRLNPEITYDEMLYSITEIILDYYELKNNDKTVKFDKPYILKTVDSVMATPFDEIKTCKTMKHTKYRINPHYSKVTGKTKKQVLGEINSDNLKQKKESRFSEIDLFYEHGLKENGKRITQKRWLDILEENGVKVSIATFNRYLTERGYKTNKPRKR